MRIIIEENYEDVSQTVASLTLAAFYQDRRVNIDLTDGSSPQGAFDIMEKVMKRYPERFHNVHFYQHDEMEGEEGTVYNILRKQIHEPFGIAKENIHKMDFHKQDAYIKQLEYDGGLDYMLLGIGADTHFCANFPFATKLDEFIYDYDPKDYPWYDAYCQGYGVTDMPRIATFGFPSVLRAKQVVVIVSGKSKAQAVKDIMTKPISPEHPGTILRTHPNLIMVLDKDAASKL